VCAEFAWFDRTICAEPCGDMHYYCESCGGRLDHCALEGTPIGSSAVAAEVDEAEAGANAAKPLGWRYALTREVHHHGSGVEESFSVREVYTNADGSLSWTEHPVAVSSDTTDGCRWVLGRMVEALSLPVLDLSLDPPAWVPKPNKN
jgi:hypothetical protein